MSGQQEAVSKGPIELKDDVWIGYGATILSGVTIGQGAVIGAGSIVVKNVPPYAIVAGNPARIIRFRFPEEVIRKLLLLDFSSLQPKKDKTSLLYTQVNEENCDELLTKLQTKRNQ